MSLSCILLQKTRAVLFNKKVIQALLWILTEWECNVIRYRSRWKFLSTFVNICSDRMHHVLSHQVHLVKGVVEIFGKYTFLQELVRVIL